MPRKNALRNLILSAMFLALSIVLSLITGHIRQIGNALCPMHLPVLLCGFFCGPLCGTVVGLAAPLLRFALFGMPPLMPTGIGMACELAVYGSVSGILYRRLPQTRLYIYVSLVTAMLSGRVVWGTVRMLLYGLGGSAFGWTAFLSGAFLSAIPGIVVQLILIPVLVDKLRRYSCHPPIQSKKETGRKQVTSMTIRYAAPSDLDAIAAVEAECFSPEEAATKQDFADRLAHYGNHFWLMLEGDKLISFVDGLVTDEPDLRDIMYEQASMHNKDGAWQMIFGVNTLPAYRRHGYAGELIRRAIEDARQQGRKGLVLTCKERLVSYYAGFGFADEGISDKSTHGNVVWHQMRLTFDDP